MAFGLTPPGLPSTPGAGPPGIGPGAPTSTPPMPGGVSSLLGPAENAYDHAKVLARVKKREENFRGGRERILRGAFRNVLFYRGIQWVIFDRITQRFRPAFLKRSTPTPVTNLFASTMDAFISVLARVEPVLKFPPATDDPDDQATSDTSERVMEVIEQEVNIREVRQSLAVWNGLCGGAWLEAGYDPDPVHGMTFLQDAQCNDCELQQQPSNQECEACGGATAPALGSDGKPAGAKVPVGRMYLEVVSPFEMAFDPAISPWSRHRDYIRFKSMDVDECKRRWKDVAEKISADSTSVAQEFLGDGLATLPSNLDDSGGVYGLTSSMFVRRPNSRTIEKWYWCLPDDEFPEGLLAVILSKDAVGYAGPLPYFDLDAEQQKQYMLPHVFFPQKMVPGTLWPKTIADDLAHKQSQHNRLESLQEQILMRMANPVWLVPKSCGIDSATGEAGEMMFYNALGPSPAKPERIPGQTPPAGIMQMMAYVKSHFEELAGTFDVIKGNRPSGVSAGITLQILEERAKSRFGPMFILWESGWSRVAEILLVIFRQFATEPRLLRIQGADGKWQVEKFMSADLRGRVNVVPEAGSGTPRSTLTDRAEIEQLAAIGVIDVQAPETNFKILQLYGKTDLLPGLAADTKWAMQENEMFEKAAIALVSNPQLVMMSTQASDPGVLAQMLGQSGIQLPEVKPGIDDNPTHSRIHRDFGRTERFRSLPKPIQDLFQIHLQQHDMLNMQQMQAMGKAPAPTSGFLAPPGGGGGGGGGNPMTHASSGANTEGQFQEGEHAAMAAPGG